MSVSRYVLVELAAELRRLLVDVPPASASDAQWADWNIRKAAVLDMLAAVQPSGTSNATEQASAARYEARRLSGSSPY